MEEKMKSSQKIFKRFERTDLSMSQPTDHEKLLLEKENFELKKTIERINEIHMDEISNYLQKIQFLEKKLSSLTNERRGDISPKIWSKKYLNINILSKFFKHKI